MRYNSFIRRTSFKNGSLLLTTLILVGCSSTKVVHRDLDAIGIQQINDLCENDCFATISYHRNGAVPDTSARAAGQIVNQRATKVESDTDLDSLYSKLRMKDIHVTLSDKRAISGRLSRVSADNNQWVLWKLDEQGQQETVQQFPATAIEEIRLLSSKQSTSQVLEVEPQDLEASSRLHIASGVLTLGTGASWPVSNLDEIAIRLTGPRNHWLGLVAGLGVGVIAGSAMGAVITRADEQPFLEGIVFGAPVGGLVGLFVGGAIGTKRVTVYKYRPDTGRQMSVLIGVGPSRTQNGGRK